MHEALTDEEERKVHEGEAAGLLLESPAFLLAIERVRNGCAEGILTSPPDQPGVRESLYNLSRGLSAVTEELVRMQNEARSLIENAKLKAQQQSDEAEQSADPVRTGNDY